VTKTRDILVGAIEARREELRKKAFALGETFSSRDAKSFAASVCAAWAKGSPRPEKKKPRKKARPVKRTRKLATAPATTSRPR
jgi:hypothetical protein